MPEYKAPLRDIRFAMQELLDFDKHYQSLPGGEEASLDMVDAILEEAGKFAAQELSPLNQSGDKGCTLTDAGVIAPHGFREAYARYIAGGWPGLAQDPEFGGQGLPESLASVVAEINGSANWSWTMYPGLSHGAMTTLRTHATEALRAQYLPPLVQGRWTGTMCLTEPQAGSDLGLLRTRAEPNDDGSYSISGTKIFISAGEHDMSENILHIVLARLPDAPAGSKGISLFLVPRFNVNADGSLAGANSVKAGSIEHKMGIHGNATCVMNFDAARGFLLGQPNSGLACMFTFMNNARLFIAQQGVCHAELSYQGALAYARERLQMRSPRGATAPEKSADPIIVHPDVRRMLLTQKALAEGGRAFSYLCAQLVDLAQAAADPAERRRAEDRLALLIPIAKGFLTEAGVEAASLGVQIFGGHGYIAEWGMEQILRDARIAPIYEGTNGIQALDLLGRKVMGSQGALQQGFAAEVQAFVEAQRDNAELAELVSALERQVQRWNAMTDRLVTEIGQDPAQLNAAAFDYLMYSGYTVLAYIWAMSAVKAQQALAAGSTEAGFYQAKLATARFYFRRILPRNEGLAVSLSDGAETLLSLHEDAFAF
jgi:hypothetical protein